MKDDVSPLIREKAPLILTEIKKADSVLLHCHPSPDPNSVGSALAMKFALEGMGKKVTVIRGDSEIPEAFMHFPGAKDIVQKNFTEIDLAGFDLFISQDCSKVDRISGISQLSFPPELTVINIDHHRSNDMFGAINLVVEDYPATAQILFDLFSEWRIVFTPELSANLYIGIYTDTGGLKFRGVSARTYEIMSKLVKIVPNFAWYIDVMENSNTPGSVAYQGVALNHVEIFLDGRLALASVPNTVLRQKGIKEEDMGGFKIANVLRRVIGWDIDVSLVEVEPDMIKVGLRTRDADKYDVSMLATALGGGGHKAAAGAALKNMPIEEAKRLVVAKAKELYNL
jgi:bifunctional oligoribonuclease and PAP phosphatase NrnA